MLIDSHCHLEYPQLADRQGVIDRARAAGVLHMVNISTTRQNFYEVLATAEIFPEVSCTVGTHPDHAHEGDAGMSAAELIRFSAHPKVVGIGETGLDYFHKDAPVQVQKDSFRAHMAAARATGLPVIVHSRQAEEDTAAMLREAAAGEGAHPLTGVLHCFSSKRVLMENAVDLGFYISLSGILTFKKSQELRDIARDVPMNRLLVETDSPYLSPEPLRGRPCEPAYVVHTARVLADVKSVSFDEITRQTTENFYRLFTRLNA